MAKTLSITVPENLYKRLQKVRDAINVSGASQDGILAVVEREELKGQEIPDADEVLERLRVEKLEWMQRDKKQGYQIGTQYAPRLHYADLKSVNVTVRNTCPNCNPEVDLGRYVAVLWDLVQRDTDLYENELKDEMQEREKADPAFSDDGFLMGWAEAVADFFDKVDEHL